MADWNGSSNAVMRPYRNASGSPPLRYFEESTCVSTAVIRRGDVVAFDTVVASASHRILRAPSSGGNGGNLLQVNVTSLLGVAAEGSTGDGSTTGLASSNGTRGTQSKSLGVYLATPGSEFLGYLSTGGAGPIIASRNLIGTRKAVVYDRNLHNFYLDSTNSTVALAAVVITDIPSESIGDSGAAPVIFKFLSTNVAFTALQ
jgi:hypothetical protein